MVKMMSASGGSGLPRLPQGPGGQSAWLSGVMPPGHTGLLLRYKFLGSQVIGALRSTCAVCVCAAPVLPHPGQPRVRPTSFRGGELLGLTARPIASAIDHHHLKFVVTVGKEAGHHAAEAVPGEAGLLSLLRHPQALQ